MRNPLLGWMTSVTAAVAVTVLFLTHPLPDRDSFTTTISNESDAQLDPYAAKRLVIDRRMGAKKELITALIEGRMSLTQVAAEFHRLNSEDEAVMCEIRMRYLGATDEEKMARNVINYVIQCDLPEGELAPVLARLEREFAAAYGSRPSGTK